MIYPNSSYEIPYWKDNKLVAGIDEAGRGPLAGPVVAAAVMLPIETQIPGINDSKKLSQKKREDLFGIIKEKSLSFALGIVEPDEIDRINILNATLKAMKLAVIKLTPSPNALLIDGINKININLTQQTITKGDSKCLSIACASILAKVTRDKIMEEYDKIYSEYKFRKHKGYPTKEHLELIKQHGACKIHRKTFRGTY
ncbi:MAG: ribonuclease HII [Candidatus Dadabacteria bacterium]|nr:ribonuclease HII [Candidatus Dadabacteria bacterium]NIV41676.1 ribonuclease HII [Candidatus Dadabacteria bacterium]NIX16262.1 ribonuclease HII [Candidatus Dadabacteria bacterium]